MNEELLQQQEQLKKQGLIKQETEDQSNFLKTHLFTIPLRNEANE